VVNSFQVNEGIMGKRMKKQLKENLAMLKKFLEARYISPTPQAIPLSI